MLDFVFCADVIKYFCYFYLENFYLLILRFSWLLTEKDQVKSINRIVIVKSSESRGLLSVQTMSLVQTVKGVHVFGVGPALSSGAYQSQTQECGLLTSSR